MLSATEFVAIISASLSVLLISHYCWLIFHDREGTDPVLATWLIFATGSTASLASCLLAPGEKDVAGSILNNVDVPSILAVLVGNILNIVDVPATWAVVICLAIRHGFRPKFDRAQKRAILIAAAVLILWVGMKLLGQQFAWPAFLTFQGYMIVAYDPFWRKLWNAERKSEPYLNWAASTLAAALAAYPAIHNEAGMGLVYAIRSAACTISVLCLIRRAERHARRNQKT